jgi:3-oxoacyl-[acyl-carrier protein] reductase
MALAAPVQSPYALEHDNMATDLKGKAVLITGASTGIGAAAARAFGRCGSNVVVHYNASRAAAEAVAADIEKLGARAALVAGDVKDAAAVKRIVDDAVAAFGRIDVLVNNAGGLVKRTRIEDYTEAFIDEVLKLNVVQVALFLRHVVPIMRRQGAGNVINVSSVAARHGGGAGAIVYAGAKGFVSAATHGWAKELAGDGIRVNAVSPGVIATPFHDRYTSAEQLKAMEANIPMKRLGSADDCAGAFVYLASNESSGYVTGQVIEVNGGQYMP